jgi:hypothetical protein
MESDPPPASPQLRRIAVAVARHPDLWVEAARMATAASPPGWWRRRPFVPVPDPEYLRWRTVTAYGGAGELPADLDDVVAFLRWRREQRS